MRRLFIVLVALVLAAPLLLRPEDVPLPFRPWGPLDLAAEPGVFTHLKLWRARDVSYCRAALLRADAAATAIPDRVVSDACHVKDAVRVTGLASSRMAPLATRCTIALRLYLWERHTLQPAAERLFGTGIAEVEHLSSYSCRRIRTVSGPSSRMSQHATANAVDISGFRLRDGRRIRLLDSWDSNGPEADFMRIARDGLCQWFNTVLGPDYNALHADHFHADMGLFRVCR